MKKVTVRQAKYFMDRVKRNDLPYLRLKEHEAFDRVLDAIEVNAYYNNVGLKIENRAKEIVKELNPKVEELIKQINELHLKIEKTKTVKTKDKLTRELNKLSMDYDNLYTNAQKEVDNYKIKVITEENRGVAIMDINDSDYNAIDNVINWTIDETPKPSIADKYEEKITEEDIK